MTNLYFEALQATTKEAANIYFTRLVTEVMEARPDLTHEESRELVNSNLGYDIGYLDDEAQRRALELYPDAQHPILGRTFGDLSTEVLLKAGMEYAKHGLQAAQDVVTEARRKNASLAKLEAERAAEADCAGATEVIEMINKAREP